MAGHEVSGISLPPEDKSIFKLANLTQIFNNSLEIDIRDKLKVCEALKSTQPDALIHLAAQPLVRKSYADPIDTFETNILGTWNLLSGIASTESIKSAVMVTTDKVYSNNNAGHPFHESDPLGWADPYSTSKAAADLIVQSWQKSYEYKNLAIARAGNVIGGGDIGEDRLIPDIIKAHNSNSPLRLRFPNATRPWQHVLDCVGGYLTLLETSNVKDISGAWNFGPAEGDDKTVESVVKSFLTRMNSQIPVIEDDLPAHLEAQRLMLNSDKAISELDWKRHLSSAEAINWTVDFHLRINNGEDYRDVMNDQIKTFKSLAK
jgi:CDP-glucose 4,6-dehydratase